jgi:hypothetical protein
MDTIGSGYDLAEGPGERNNEPSASIKHNEFPDYLSDC